jgi:hypothetical protein
MTTHRNTTAGSDPPSLPAILSGRSSASKRISTTRRSALRRDLAHVKKTPFFSCPSTETRFLLGFGASD